MPTGARPKALTKLPSVREVQAASAALLICSARNSKVSSGCAMSGLAEMLALSTYFLSGGSSDSISARKLVALPVNLLEESSRWA